MGWNSGYTAMEAAVIATYDAGTLNAEVLDKIMEPYKGTDCDSGGSHDLMTKDGLGVKEVICKIMKPAEYKDAIENPRMYEDFEDDAKPSEMLGMSNNIKDYPEMLELEDNVIFWYGLV